MTEVIKGNYFVTSLFALDPLLLPKQTAAVRMSGLKKQNFLRIMCSIQIQEQELDDGILSGGSGGGSGREADEESVEVREGKCM